jgi:hypothetical protein
MRPPELQEAWPGRRMVWGRRALIHLVEWAPRQGTGLAVCGRTITFCAVFPAGSAHLVRVPVCGYCLVALERRRPTATVTPIVRAVLELEDRRPDASVTQLRPRTPRPPRPHSSTGAAS